jgi:uncharacterized protein involved in outer membrane biogenesis
MTFLKRIIFRLLALGVVLIIIFVLARNTIGTWISTSLMEKATNFPSSIAFLDIQLMHPRVIAREISLLNPRESFQEPIAAKLNRVEMDYEPIALFQGSPHLYKLLFDLENVTIVRNSEGQINLFLLKNSSNTNSSDRMVQIDELTLSLNHLTYLDESKLGHKPSIYTLHSKPKTYKNIKSTADVKKILYKFIVDSLPEETRNLAKLLLGTSIQHAPTIWDAAKSLIPKMTSQTPDNSTSNEVQK